ncbi:MAG: TIGR03960 family B12-binding radical SAM protein [Candidatus Omnitrophica bacterium]|nr:TIGR03960 family B12-binding radical SAM protein [Candidatus Omnitrophota bacterium]
MGKSSLEQTLRRVTNPARYTGREINAIIPPEKSTFFRIALGYPDLYEVGMSSLGIRILYGLLNEMPGVSCQRFFAPDEDLEFVLKKEGWPLFALESKEPLASFDVVAFSLSSELNYTSLLNLLHLAKIPLKANEREEKMPLVIVGGSCAVNPLPLSAFVDAFVIGEGEEVIQEIVQTLKFMKGCSKQDKLEALAKMAGVYVPGISVFPVKRRVIADFENCYFPVRWLVPLTEVVHDRITVEIMRGCPRRCRFCAASYCWKPVRFRSPERILEIARQAYRWSGCEEISLLSFSSGDHPEISKIVEKLMEEFSPRRVALSFPSLRADTFSFQLAAQIKEIRKTGLTFAPESSQRLRQILGKTITDEETIGLAKKAKETGWRQIKLYYMLGLPGETEKDVEEIIRLTGELSRILAIHASFNTFIPKCHTPLERENLCSRQEFEAKVAKLRGRLGRLPRVKLSFHPYEMSVVETFLGRGDAALSEVIFQAWRKGARLENWSEHFNFSYWQESFKESGLNLNKYCQQQEEPVLPWKIIKV